MSRGMLLIFALLAAALAVLTGLAVRKGVLGPPPPQEQTVAIGGPFQLIDKTGRPVDEEVLTGKWSAVFFGFTYCPDICPTTLYELRQVEDLLGDRADDFQTVFISVDPERDTPEQVATYLSNDAFPDDVVGLTGSPEQVRAAAKAYRVYYQKSGEGPDYMVNHASYTYLMNPKGRFVCVLPYDLTPEQVAQKVQAAMRTGPQAESC